MSSYILRMIDKYGRYHEYTFKTFEEAKEAYDWRTESDDDVVRVDLCVETVIISY